MESSRNSTTMMGRKESTLPTPARCRPPPAEVDHGVGAKGGEPGVDARRDPGHEFLHEALQPRAHHAEGEPEDQAHDEHEGRDGGVATGEHAVDAGAAGVLAALVGLDHAAAADLADEREAHVGQGGEAVGPGLLLHLADDVLDAVELVGVEAEGSGDQLVSLDELGGRKAHGDAGALRVVVHQVADAVDATVKGAAVGPVGRAEVQAARAFAVARHVQCVLHELGDALVLGGADGNHRDAQEALQPVDVHGAAVGRELVHHVKRQHHGAVELHELEREVEVPLYVGGVDYVDDGIGVGVQDELAAHDLLAGVGRQRVDARQVRDRGLGVPADLAVLAVHGDAGEVAHVLVGARELVEERGLSAVLVAGEGKGQGPPLGHGGAGAPGREALLA